MIFPNISRKDKLKPYEEVFIAHRGLFDNAEIPENSIPAFKKAVEAGLGIELDVQLSRDNQLVVFHDESLFRMTGVNKLLRQSSYEELKKYKLLNTEHAIPLLSDVLKVLNKNTPLIIEIKPEGRYIETTKYTVELMRTYAGLYNMESFNPLVVKYLKDNEPQIIRGQLAYNSLIDKKSKTSPLLKFILTNLLLNFLTRPDYIAYDHNSMNNLSFLICSKIYRAKCVAWTIKSDDDYNRAKAYYDCFIFDSYIPNAHIGKYSRH